MHSAKGHTVVDERWRLQLTVAAVCRSLAPRPSDSLASMLTAQSTSASDTADAPTYRALSYYTYRYL